MMRQTPQKIILLHGLFMHGSLLFPLRQRLKALGYECMALSYSSVRKTCRENAQLLIDEIRVFAGGETVYFVGHSLGGLLLRHIYSSAPDLCINSRAVTLGTPHRGSEVARYLYAKSCMKQIIGNAWSEALDGHAPAWNPKVPLLSIAGVRPIGIGRLLGLLKEQPSDGVVSVAETRLPEAAAYQEIDAVHTLLPYLPQSADYIQRWFSACRNDKYPDYVNSRSIRYALYD